MTCIVGLVDKNAVYMGCDSAGVDSLYNLHIRKDSKLFLNGPFLIGFTSSFRMGQLLQYTLSAPEQAACENDFSYMVTKFVPAVMKCFKDGGFCANKDGVQSGGTFMVGYKNAIYTIHDDFQVAINQLNYEAVGCGANFAMGSLFSTGGQEPTKRIKEALKAAETLSAGVSGPFVIKTMKNMRTHAD